MNDANDFMNVDEDGRFVLYSEAQDEIERLTEENKKLSEEVDYFREKVVKLEKYIEDYGLFKPSRSDQFLWFRRRKLNSIPPDYNAP
jgi:predicted nuclease with TOPRIM domain